ncbi:MobA/MobL family protein [Methylocystis sp. IM4]|uniref:MobA/MobL family protein n=1 Tax=Methylocystis sp. IM4 TaxID=3136560 RepID=UPI00311A1D6E
MPIYYLNVDSVRRSAGRNVITAAAYCSRSRLRDERHGRTVDFSSINDLVHSEILLPAGSPERWADREALWNEVEKIETRANAQLALEIEAAIADGLTTEQGVTLAREFVKMQFVGFGRIVDLNIQKEVGADGQQRAYLYALLSMREICADAFGKKIDDWHGPKLLMQWRERWAQLSNKHLLAAGCPRFIRAGANAARERSLDALIEPLADHSAANFEIAWRNGERLLGEPELAFEALTATSSMFSRQEMVEFVKRNTVGNEQFDAALARIECSVELSTPSGGRKI